MSGPIAKHLLSKTDAIKWVRRSRGKHFYVRGEAMLPVSDTHGITSTCNIPVSRKVARKYIEDLFLGVKNTNAKIEIMEYDICIFIG